MKRILSVVLVIVALAALVYADSTTTYFGLSKMSRGASNWDTKINSNMDLIDAALNAAATDSDLATEAATRASADSTETSQRVAADLSESTTRAANDASEAAARTAADLLIVDMHACDNATVSCNANCTFPETYGAVGDNATDDSAAFALTVGSLASGSAMCLKAGTDYKANIEIVNKSLTIRGAGGQCPTTSRVPGIHAYDPTKPAIKIYSTETGDEYALTMYDVAIYGNQITSETGLHLGPGSNGSRITNCCVAGFVKDNVLVGDYDNMTSPITSVTFQGVEIRSENYLGNCLRIRAGENGGGYGTSHPYNWITQVAFNGGLIYHYALGARDASTWTSEKSYSAHSVIKATDDHNPDNSTSDWGFVWETTSDCVAGTTEPTWGDPSVGDEFVDGTCTWVTHQRGRLLSLLDAGINMSNTYLETGGHFRGIRLEYAANAVWIPYITFANTIITDNAITEVAFENQYNSWNPEAWLNGNLYIYGYYKPRGIKAYRQTMFNINGVSGGTVSAHAVQILPYVYQGHNEVQPYGYLSYDNATNVFDISVIPDPWNDTAQKWDIRMQGRGFGNVQIGATGASYSVPHLMLGERHLWNEGSDLYFKDSAPSNGTDGKKILREDATTMRLGIRNSVNFYTVPTYTRFLLYDDNLTMQTVYNQSNLNIASTSDPAAKNAVAIMNQLNSLTIHGDSDLGYYNGIWNGAAIDNNNTMDGYTAVDTYVNYSGTGTLTANTHFWASLLNNSTGTVASNYGFRAGNPNNAGGGSITNNYAFYADDQTGGTNNYSLYLGSGLVRMNNTKTPANASEACVAGEQAWDANYIYVCVATNTWKRSGLSSW